MKNINKLRQERVAATAVIQKEYDTLTTYSEKFAYIYDLLFQNLSDYAKWVGCDIFTKKNQLLKLAEQITTNGEFMRFLDKETIIPLQNGHYFMQNKQTNNQQKNNIINDDNFTHNLMSNNTLYLCFKSFSNKFLQHDKEKFSDLKSKIMDKDIKNVIIDLRGNSGGTDAYLNEILSLLETSLSYKIEWHNTLFNKNEGYTCDHNYGDKKYSFYILTDNKVFSAAECITRAFKQNNATIVGSATHGDAGMSPKLELQILTYVNKDTGKSTDLMLHIPIQVPINNNGKVDFNYINTQPTIACNSENALNVVLDIISEKNM